MRVAVAGWIGSSNLGDEMLFAATKRELESRGAVVTAISARPATTRRDHGCDAVSLYRPDAMWRVFGGIDALVLIAGTMQDLTSPLNLPVHTTPLWMARARGVRAFGAAIGVEVRTGIGRRMVKRGLESFELMTVRDHESADALARVGLPRPPVTADLVLQQPQPVVARTNRIGVALRTWPGPGWLPASMRWRRGLADDDAISSMAARLDELDRPITFLAFQPGRDDELHRRIGARMAAPVDYVTPSVASAAADVASCAAIVTMRYHAAVLAAATATPLAIVDVFGKLKALARDLDAATVWPVLPGAPSDIAALLARAKGNVELFDRVVR